MNIIYKPKGRAKEFAELALNIYKGCTHGCKYCYNTKPGYITSDDYFSSPNPKMDIISKLRKDCEKLAGTDCPEILLSFVGDPYQPAERELGLTRETIKVLIEYDLPFTILTKGGLRAARDFDLLKNYPKFRFGTSLVFANRADCNEWEPDAASPESRVAGIIRAKSKGIKTWVSLEPVIDPMQALAIIEKLSKFVHHWKIGKINHMPEIESQYDWKTWRDGGLIPLLKSVGADYYLKKSLTEL